MKKIIVSIFILLPLFSFAASTDYTLLEPLPPIENSGQSINCDDPNLKMVCKIDSNHYIAYVFNFSIAFASVAAVIVIIIAGFEYATSGIANTKSDAKSRIENAILGLVTILCSYLILKTIDPRLVEIDTKLPEISEPGQVFDYSGLEDVANSKINQDLTDAVKTIKPLQAEAKTLRDEADTIDARILDIRKQIDTGATENTQELELKAQQLYVESQTKKQKAINLENQATLIGSNATLKAGYDRAENILNEIDGAIITTSQKEEIALRKQEMQRVADKNIKKLVDSGDAAGAQKLQEEKAFYEAKIDQTLVIKKNLTAVQIISSSSIYDGARKEVGEKSIKEIQAFTFDATKMDAENAQKLQQEKNDAIDIIDSIIHPPSKK